MNHYERLGVGTDARPDEIRTAYRRRARGTHPDATGSVDDGEMSELNEAWFVLRDPDRRRSYDRLVGAARSTDEDEPRPTAVPVGGGSVDRSARRLVAMVRASIVLSVAAGVLFLLIALLQGH